MEKELKIGDCIKWIHVPHEWRNAVTDENDVRYMRYFIEESNIQQIDFFDEHNTPCFVFHYYDDKLGLLQITWHLSEKSGWEKLPDVD